VLLFMSNELQYRHNGIYDELSSKSMNFISELKKLPIVEKIIMDKPLDYISLKKLGDEQYWWVLAYINNIMDPMGVSYGTPIKIPDRSAFDTLIVDIMGRNDD
jgi:hypothetical protein